MTHEHAHRMLDQLNKFFGEPVLPLSAYRAALERVAAGMTEDYTPDGRFTDESITVGELCLHAGTREVRLREQQVRLKPREFDLLWVFARNRDMVLRREILLERVWGIDYDGDIRTIDVHVRRIRRALGEYGARYLQTHFGVGYQLCAQERATLRAVA